MKISGWEPHKLREIALSVFIISVALLVICAALALISKPLNKLFPLPPQSEEHREYTNHANLSGGSATSETDPNQNQSESEKDKSPSDDENELVFIKDKRDLNAQEGMWRAANYLVVLTFFQIFIGLGTVILVWRTFWVQRDELGATKQANILQLTPYIEIPNVRITYIHNLSHVLELRIALDIKNVGFSPATKLTDAWIGRSEVCFWQDRQYAPYSLEFVGNGFSGTVWDALNSKQIVTYNKTLFFVSPTPATIFPFRNTDILDIEFIRLDTIHIEMFFTFSDTLEGNIRYMRVVITRRSSVNGGIVITGRVNGLEIWATELTADVGERLLRRCKDLDEKREMPELWPA